MHGMSGSTPLTHRMDQELGMNQDVARLRFGFAQGTARQPRVRGWAKIGSGGQLAPDDHRAEPRCSSPTGYSGFDSLRRPSSGISTSITAKMPLTHQLGQE